MPNENESETVCPACGSGKLYGWIDIVQGKKEDLKMGRVWFCKEHWKPIMAEADKPNKKADEEAKGKGYLRGGICMVPIETVNTALNKKGNLFR